MLFFIFKKRYGEMMENNLVLLGGVYHVGLIIFHLFFWRIFNWPESINSLNKVNKSTIQVLNITITFIFVIFSYISFFHTYELLNTILGKSILMFLSILWIFRAIQQVLFYKLKHKLSIFLTAYFIFGGLLYGIPAIS